VLDPDTPFLEISPLAAYDSDYTMGGGMVVGIGVIAGTECVILANDPSVLGGALTPYAAKKWSGPSRSPATTACPTSASWSRPAPTCGWRPRRGGRRRVQTDHFAETGRFFYEMIELSKLRIPTVCVVFGSSTAGGAYQPGLSDYTIVVKDQSKIFLAGPPLVKMATGEESDDETLGGARSTPRCRASATTSPRTRWTPSACAARWCRTSTGARPGPAPCGPTSPSTTPRSCSAW
jgi:acyl-CoA carboxylase subunit beta